MIENYVGKMNTLLRPVTSYNPYFCTRSNCVIRTLRGHIERRVLRINGASVLNRLNLEKM